MGRKRAVCTPESLERFIEEHEGAELCAFYTRKGALYEATILASVPAKGSGNRCDAASWTAESPEALHVALTMAGYEVPDADRIAELCEPPEIPTQRKRRS